MKMNSSGQTTIEFILTFILLLSFLFFFLQLSMVMAFGNYVHYATFMAARAYLSSGIDTVDQTDRAKNVMVRMVKRSEGQSGTDKFPTIARGFGGDGDVPGLALSAPGNYNQLNQDFSWLQGVRYTFRSKIFVLPLGGLGKAAAAVNGNPNQSANLLELTSESWLGREQTSSECQKSMAMAYDNGC